MKNLILFTFFLFFSCNIFAQNTDRTDVIAVVDALFDAMRKADGEAVDSLFLPNATLKSVFRNENGVRQLESGKIDEFIAVIGKETAGTLDERIWSYDVNIDADMATVWTDYTFYYAEKMSHCGVNSFTLHRTLNGWKILDITDTRSRQNCRTEPVDTEKAVNDLMNAWHRAAAVADEDVFFGSMTAEGIYIGTDKTELWTRDEMAEWAQQYFERDSAWDFKTIERNVYTNANGETAWFDEKLDTWMGVCRASGVVENINGTWKIAHYHLSITVDNDLVKDFLKLTEKK